ncbi:Gp49 family protein [Sphingomonas lacusdianchii]|uniref:Gp49 family protein n=1 Tax=Sphingomonas lacusdianchii TaxID=2917992 RepID=UPI001F5989E2|nr:Gp49 family protein [Sphingomonas sp. JXJ CY 53]
MNDAELNAAIAARPAAKVTPERISEVIVGEAYHRLTDTLTVCVLTLANGFTVTGESACASPANYDETIGNALARKQAESKVWGLEGYLLREKLALADHRQPA